MQTQRTRAYCRRCKHAQSFERGAVNHRLHLLLTILTLGLWSISWVAITLGNIFKPWRCKHCGWHDPEFDTEPKNAPGDSHWLNVHESVSEKRSNRRRSIPPSIVTLAAALLELI